MQHRSSKKGSTLAVIIFTIFIDLLGFGILIPVLPYIFTDPGSLFYIFPSGYSPEKAYIFYGLLIAVYPIAQFFTAPILGQLSDRFGRKTILAFALASTAVSYVFFALGILSKSLLLLFASRALSGITGGNISVAQAAIADITEEKDRTKNFGLIGAAFGLGFILGPYIGGKLSDNLLVSWFDATTPFWFAAVLSLLNFMSITMFFKNTNERNLNTRITWGNSLKNIFRAYEMKGFNSIFLSAFLFNAGFTFFTTFFAVFMIDRFSFGPGEIADLFAYIGVCMVVVQVFLVRFVARYFSEERVLRWSIIMSAVATLAYVLATSSIQLIFLVPFFVVFNALSQINLTGLVSRLAPGNIQGEILGINASVTALAQAIPPVFSGFIAAKFAAGSPIIIAGIMTLLSGITFLLLYRPKAKHDERP